MLKHFKKYGKIEIIERDENKELKFAFISDPDKKMMMGFKKGKRGCL